MTGVEFVREFSRLAASGASIPTIAKAIGSTPVAVSVRASRMRKRGVRLPYIAKKPRRMNVAALNQIVREEVDRCRR